MTSRVLKLTICTVGLAVAMTASASAAPKTKKTHQVAPQTAAANSAPCRGANVYHCGPLYNSQEYLGSDPDPFIRAMIQRDLGAKYGPGD